jgi:hypothetical protein
MLMIRVDFEYTMLSIEDLLHAESSWIRRFGSHFKHIRAKRTFVQIHIFCYDISSLLASGWALTASWNQR